MADQRLGQAEGGGAATSSGRRQFEEKGKQGRTAEKARWKDQSL